MSESKDGGPAFPSTYRDAVGTAYEHQVVLTGMSLRDYFAGQVISAIFTDDYANDIEDGEAKRAVEAAANLAYLVADAMLKARGQ